MTADAIDPTADHKLALARRRIGLLVVALTCTVVGSLAALALNANDLGDRLDDAGAAGIPVLVVVGAILIAAMVPASLVAGAGGFALGTPLGTPVALAACCAGATLCAVLGRWVGTPTARWAFGERVTRTAAWLEAHPARSVVIARLLPGMPFNATSYVLGFTRIPLTIIAAASTIGFAPRCFAYVALGGSLRDLSSPQARVALGLSAVVAIAAIAIPRALLSDEALPDSVEEDING